MSDKATFERKYQEKHIYDHLDESPRPNYYDLWDEELFAQLHQEYYWDRNLLCQEYLEDREVLILGANARDVSQVALWTDERNIYAMNLSEIELNSIKNTYPDVRTFMGDAERIYEEWEWIPPFDSGLRIDVVYTSQIFHHLFPVEKPIYDIAKCLLNPGGVLLVTCEPSKWNLPAWMARWYTPSAQHTPGEKPLDFTRFRRLFRRDYETLYENYYFLWSHVFPYYARQFPWLRSLCRKGIKWSLPIERAIRRFGLFNNLYWVFMGAYRIK